MAEDMGGRVNRIRDSVKHRFQHFRRDTRAGATSLVAASAAAMVVGAGVLVGDYMWMMDQRDRMKASTDAGAIASAIGMFEVLRDDPDITDENLTATVRPRVETYVAANFADLPEDQYREAIGSLELDLRLNRPQTTSTVKVRANWGGPLLSHVFPSFGEGLLEAWAHTASSSEALVPPLEVVLAIDVSSSMNTIIPVDGQSRLSAVKDAAIALVDTLAPDRNSGVAIGIVPWNYRVGLQQREASRWETEGWAQYPRSRNFRQPYLMSYGRSGPPEVQDLPPRPFEWDGCLDLDRIVSGTLGDLPETEDLFSHPSNLPVAFPIYPSHPATAYKCQRPPAPPDFQQQECYEQTNEGAQGTQRTDIFDPQCSNVRGFMAPLNTDTAQIKRDIRAMRGSGSTQSSMGVIWAQNMLTYEWSDVWNTPPHPLNPDAPINAKMRKVIVLLTDGSDGTSVDIERFDACRAAKAQGTEIYTISAFRGNNTYRENLLRSCSSEDVYPDRDFHFRAANKQQIIDAFSEISLELSAIRLTEIRR